MGWKSLLLSTLQEYFEGNKDLFKEIEVSRLEQAVANSWSLCFDRSHPTSTTLSVCSVRCRVGVNFSAREQTITDWVIEEA